MENNREEIKNEILDLYFSTDMKVFEIAEQLNVPMEIVSHIIEMDITGELTKEEYFAILEQ